MDLSHTSSVLEICQLHAPQKKIPDGKPKVMNALRRKKNRIKARYNALVSKGMDSQAATVKQKLSLIHYDIKEAFNKASIDKEQSAVKRIKENSKFFFSYAKSLSKVKSTINMLYDKDRVITTDDKAMADILQEQFVSVFSNPLDPDVKDPEFGNSIPQGSTLSFSQCILSCESIVAAINEIPNDSAPGPDGIPVVLLKNCAAELAVPIKAIWSESILLQTVPKFYKQTCVSPLYKSKGSRAEAINYRPIALTSHIMKIYERILRLHMVNFIEDNNMLCNGQHGFRAGRSCLTQLLCHFDEIMQGLTNGCDTDAIYLDFAKAFDKVDHRLLLLKLKQYGFGEDITNWISSFLSDRSQNVVVNGQTSYLAKIISGVPQGTVLGPLLFILFVNDMHWCVKHSTIRLFADDTRLLKRISSSDDVNLLQSDLESVINWAKENNMTLHEDKFEYIVHRHNQKDLLLHLPFMAEAFSYTLTDGKSLYPVEFLKDLGVMVSSDMSWSLQISTIVKRARSMASWVLGAFHTREKVAMLLLYTTLVRSLLEYCCLVWHPHKVGDIELIEGVQRTFTSKIHGVQHLDYWDRLKALGLMSLQRRRERYMIIHMWKLLNGVVPNDIGVQFSSPSRHGVLAKLPGLSRSSSSRNQTIYDNSFAMVGPQLWNLVPASVQSIADPQQFKVELSRFIATFPDKPPTKGYSRSNGNSLLDWGKNVAARQAVREVDSSSTQ